MSHKIFKMLDLFKTSGLVLRKDARYIHDIVIKEVKKPVTLDFENIEYSSLSFMDELNNILQDLKDSGREIKIINFCDNLDKLFKLIQNRPYNIHNMTNASVSPPIITKI